MTVALRHLRQHQAGLGLLVVVALAAVALGQWQVNNQVGAVNNRVGGELYGNNTNMGSVRYAAYSQRTVLPSEARYATWRSGALPSEVAMNAAAVGPLAPNGAISYVPPPSPVQSAMKMPSPQLYNPAYDIGGRPLDAQIAAPRPGFESSAAGSMRYASVPQATSAQIAPGQISGQIAAPVVASAQLPSGELPDRQLRGLNAPAAPSTSSLILSGSALNSGSVRYGSMSK